jgi:hypothetical protein
MPSAEARIPTDRASRYLVQLCQHTSQLRRRKHFSPIDHGDARTPPEVRHVEWSDNDGTVRFPDGKWTLRATSSTLTLQVEADDEDTLQRLVNGVTRRVETIGRRDQIRVAWQRPGTPTHQPAGTLVALDTGIGKRRRSGRLSRTTTIGIVAGGILVLVVHIGLGGTALATTRWVGWTTNVILAVILLKILAVAGHLVLRRRAIHRGETFNARRKQQQSSPEPDKRGP